MQAASPIGVFDSGLGGLTVAAQIERALPGESLLYLGDTARVPYGVKSPETVLRYSQEICEFLLHHQVKAIVVACNTASAVALPQLQARYPVPVLGVIEPGAAAALSQSQSGLVGVIGTEATIKSEAYTKALQAKRADMQVMAKACPLFVPLAETGWAEHPITHQVAREYLGEWLDSDLDTVILGCTHYPLLKPVLQKTLGERVSLVDSAKETAKALKALLAEQGLLSAAQTPATRRYLATDAPDKMRQLAQQFLGHTLEKVERADIQLTP